MSDSMIDTILKTRYYLEGESSWDDICHRVANYLGESKEERDAYFDIMSNKRGCPNSPCLFNAGTSKPQMSACFVLEFEDDSIDAIYKTLWESAKIMKSGGGFGFNLSKLRPKNSKVGVIPLASSGCVSFLHLFDESINVIKQGSRRRGAGMALLNWNHPDIMDFLHCKENEGQIRNFNLSVCVDEEFFGKLARKEFNDVICQAINDDGSKRDITFGEVWEAIITGAHKNGEPGLFYKDNINEANQLINVAEIIACNPCAEEAMIANSSCVLFSSNVAKFVKNGKFDYDAFEKDIRWEVRFLNRVVDKNLFPTDKIAEVSRATRQIGLGVMGLHDAMLLLRIPYDSEEGLKFADELMSFLEKITIDESHELAMKYGVFPLYDKSEWNIPVRNAAMRTCAPTGSISILCDNTSSGIEPVFSWVHARRTLSGSKEFLVVHPLFEADLKKMVDGDEKLYDEIIAQIFKEGSLQNVDCLPDEVKRLYKTALDIDPIWHIRMLATVQKHIDAGVSKTINLPSNITKEEIGEMYQLAHEMGCKGLTVYRTGSRNDVVMSRGEEKDKNGFIQFVKDGEMWKKCPECGHEFKSDVGGCITCPNCAYSHCSN